MEKKNVLPEFQKQLLFNVEYKLFRDSEVLIADWSDLSPILKNHSIQFVNGMTHISIIYQKTIANKEEKYHLYCIYWWILSSEIWSVKHRRIKFEMVEVPRETFSKG